MFDSAWCLATWALTSSIDRRLSGWLESAAWRARSLLDGGMTFMVIRASLFLSVPLNGGLRRRGGRIPHGPAL